MALRAGGLYPWPIQGSLSDFQNGLQRASEMINSWGTEEHLQLLSKILLVEMERLKKNAQPVLAWIAYLEFQP